MEKRTCIWISIPLHNILKHRAVDNRSTIEKELIKIIEPELREEEKKKLLKRENINVNT